MDISADKSKHGKADEVRRGVDLLFGPIPSRRLGSSLGINSIPPKICSYSCVYCQIGLTNSLMIKRREFFTPAEIYRRAEAGIDELRIANQSIDYLTFVPDGEPSLDINIGATIEKLKPFGIKIAVITNASMNFLHRVCPLMVRNSGRRDDLYSRFANTFYDDYLVSRT